MPKKFVFSGRLTFKNNLSYNEASKLLKLLSEHPTLSGPFLFFMSQKPEEQLYTIEAQHRDTSRNFEKMPEKFVFEV